MTVRWVSVAVSLAALAVGDRVLGMAPPLWAAGPVVGAAALSNIVFAWWTRRRRPLAIVPGLLVSCDVAVLTWLLMNAGGPLNPVSIFFIVYIVLAALVLGTAWTWTIATLAIAGYGALFLAPHPELMVAGAMHPEIGLHVVGMWWAFAVTALLVAILVARLSVSVARRDRALADLRERTARHARLAGLATLAAGAAHELSTPLGTVAVAARELERALGGATPAVAADLALIQDEVRRCRQLLDNLAARAGQPLGEMPERVSLDTLLAGVSATLDPADRERVRIEVSSPGHVTWPREAMTQALANLARNGLQASPPSQPVLLHAEPAGAERVRLRVVDRGAGMSADALARLGEPFFTTKPAGSGMGLGAFVSRATIEQLGGSVAFESTPGVGTQVTIDLPRHITWPGTPGQGSPAP